MLRHSGKASGEIMNATSLSNRRIVFSVLTQIRTRGCSWLFLFLAYLPNEDQQSLVQTANKWYHVVERRIDCRPASPRIKVSDTVAYELAL